MSGLIHNALYSAREGAGWTTLGRVIDPAIATDPVAIMAALGPYAVEKRPAYYGASDTSTLDTIRAALARGDVVDPGLLRRFFESLRNVPERSALVGVWDNVESAKGIAGADGANTFDDSTQFFEFASDARYHIDYRQPLDILESFRDELAKERLEMSHVASLKGGRIIVACARLAHLDEAARVGGDSETHAYVCASAAWDKSHVGAEYWVTLVRAVCDNTRRAGVQDAEGKGRLFRKTASQRLTANSLRDLMGNALGIVQADQAEMQRLVECKITSGEAREYFAKLLEIDTQKIGQRDASNKKIISTRSENQLATFQASYARGKGADLPAANGTLYGAFQAVCDVVDHDSQIRDTMREGNTRARMTSATFGTGAQLKARAVQTASEMVADLLARPMSLGRETLSEQEGSAEFSRLLGVA